MVSKRTLLQTLLLSMVLVTTISCLVIGGLWIVQEYRRFNEEAALLHKQYTEARKREMKQHVDDVVGFVHFKRSQTEQRTRQILRERVDEAHGIASRIYEQYKDSKELAEIQDMVREILRSIRFHDGRGYFFATRLDGVEQLFADRPELEGLNLLDMQDTRGAYVIRDMIELVREKGEGYYAYTWTKPDTEGREHLKLSFIKYFAPFDWFIGTGEYLGDVEKDLQAEALEWIKQIRYGEEGYVFAGQWDGLALSGPETGKNMIDVTDPNGVKIVQELIRCAKENGGFLSYVMPKFEGQRPDPKISYANGVEEWQWYIGTGLYMDDIEDAVAALRSQQITKMWWNIGTVILVLGLLWLAAYLIVRRMAGKTRAAFAAFSSFFEEAAIGSAEVPVDGLGFPEFEKLAMSANHMIALRRETEQALRESEERFRSLVEQTSDAVFCYEYDPPIPTNVSPEEQIKLFYGGVLVECNDVCAHSYGYAKAGEVIGKKLTDLFGTTGGSLDNFFEQFIRDGYRMIDGEGVEINPDGSKRYFLNSGYGIIENARLLRVWGTYRDITVRMQAEAALRESEARFRELFENMGSGAAVYEAIDDGRDFVFKDINPAGARIGNLKREEHLGRSVTEVYPGVKELGLFKVFQEVWRSGTPQHYPVSTYEDDRIALWVENYVCKLPGGEIVAVYNNVTEQKRAEQQKLQLEEQYRQAQKMEAVGQLTGGVAHDFNNLLQVINGYTALAAAELSPDSPARDFLGEVAAAGERAAGLVSQLLLFSRRQVIRPEPVELEEVVAGLLKMLERIIGEHIQIQWHPGGQGGRIFADRSMVEQALMNLCVNARDAMPEGGTMTIQTCEEVIDEEYCWTRSWARPGRYAVLRVSDTGSGMDEKTLNHIFEPFFSTKERGKGTGLGLATVYGIVKQHGGMIDVDSEPGQGSTFSLYWPLSESQTQVASTVSEAIIPGGRETILLAEDDESVRSLARLVLEQAGYTVLAASNGAEALALFEEHSQEIDLAILDSVMPKMGGRETLQRICDRRPGFTAIFTSGYGQKDMNANSTLAEDMTLIQKPFTRETLLRTVRRVLNRGTS